MSMREYARVAPQFWVGTTGKALRKAGPEAVVVALYLVSSPHSNMIGLYCQPELYMAHETGLGIEGALKGLRSCIEAGFCSFDEASEVVWVHEMAAWQIADELKPTDKRCKGIRKELDKLPDHPYRAAFLQRYGQVFNLVPPEPEQGKPAPKTHAPSKPLRSQEQEQEQEQEQDSCGEPEPLRLISPSPPPEPVIDLPLTRSGTHSILQAKVDAWSEAFPAVDVLAELRRMRAWLDARPRERKTAGGIERFIVGWLGKSQDRGRANQPAAKAVPKPWEGGI